MLVAAVGNAVATGTTSLGGRFFAMFLMPMGAVSACKYLEASGEKGLVWLGDLKLIKLNHRSNHCLLGGKLFPPSARQAIRLYCHRQHDW